MQHLKVVFDDIFLQFSIKICCGYSLESPCIYPPYISQNTTEKRLEEQRKYGVFYDDDYDYMQHLKEVDEAFELVQDNRHQTQNETDVKVGKDLRVA